MKIGIVLGTRPEIIKMSPIIRACQERNLDFRIIHTGQHYSYKLDETFFIELGLPTPHYNLHIGSESHSIQTGKIMMGIEKVLLKEKLDITLVQGDTNTVLAGSLASAKLNIPVGHVEAGLRSNDRTMPEEINRIVSDHVSDLLFAPTEVAKNNLLFEGISEDIIHVTGNTIVDSIYQNIEEAKKSRNPFVKYDLSPKNYFLATVHRAENTNDASRLENIFNGFQRIHEQYNIPVLIPLHPRTEKAIEKFNIDTNNIQIIEPVGYLDFLLLESNARLILTDSGGVQEEACILGVPCATLRNNTERPETIQIGANVLVGTEPQMIINGLNEMLNENLHWNNPYGKGDSAHKILDKTVSFLSK